MRRMRSVAVVPRSVSIHIGRKLSWEHCRPGTASSYEEERSPRQRPRAETPSANDSLDQLAPIAYSHTSSRGSNSVVECHLAKVDVEGSNPFSRSEKVPSSCP